MSNFFQRVITGVILIFVTIFFVVISRYGFVFLVAMINILGLNEFYNLHRRFEPKRYIGLFFSTLFFITVVLFVLNPDNWKILLLNIPAAFAIFVSELFLKSANPFERLAFTFMGIVYITVPSIFLAAIAFLPFQTEYHSKLIIGLFFIIWASDSGAYAFGNLFGRHSLFKKISPKKTWEGSIGGFFSAILTAFIVSIFYKEINLSDWVCIAIIADIIGSFGDLVKSILKRTLNLKNSGTVLPGHGGILDRYDSLLSSAPFIFIYLVLIHY